MKLERYDTENPELGKLRNFRFGIELARYRIPLHYFSRAVINAEIWNPQDAVSAGFYDRTAPAEQLAAAAAMAAEMFGNLNMTAFNGTKNKSRKDLLELLDRCIEMDLVVTQAPLFPSQHLLAEPTSLEALGQVLLLIDLLL